MGFETECEEYIDELRRGWDKGGKILIAGIRRVRREEESARIQLRQCNWL